MSLLSDFSGVEGRLITETNIERANIEIRARAYEKFALIINGGSQIDVSFLDDMDKSKVIYQFTTAFPVACALAPALNIHRNPLCSRNFEYYSEDPFLSGKMAAAITKGIQCEEGYYVAIKHYACNNQEDNRKNVSSNLSERALREGGAKGVMTSYNKVNGVYVTNNYDLYMKVLRNEWGFEVVLCKCIESNFRKRITKRI